MHDQKIRKKAAKPLKKLSADVDQSLGFLICDTARYVTRTLYARLAPYNIPGASWFLLRVLWAGDGLTQRELSNKLGLKEPSVLKTLHEMERKGIVTRERDTQDKRKIRIFLTQRAIDLKEELSVVAEEVNQIMVGDLTRAQEETVMDALRTVRVKLSEDLGVSDT